jgi:hypothetical protein
LRAGQSYIKARTMPVDVVITGLDPAIHHRETIDLFLMGARVKPGHDGFIE